jgi:8-oxo-dGTP diphosphatase
MDDLFGRDGKRPAIGCDSVILTQRPAGNGEKAWWILLIERGHEPFKGKWALPGGFMEWNESCEQAAARELQEETSIKNVDLTQLGAFSRPGRDPRGTSISVAYVGIINSEDAEKASGGDDAAKAEWFPLESHPELAFDHDEIVDSAKKFLKSNF